MTASSSGQSPIQSLAAPPPECPAHASAPPNSDGLADLFGAENERDATGLYERLRAEHGPVAPVVLDGDLRAWLLLGYRENLEVTRTPSRFSRDSRRWRDLREGRVPADSRLLPVVAWQPTCVFADGEEHERLRNAVTESMGRIDRRGIRRHIMRFAHQLIDDFCADGEAELVSQFAEHLPMMILTYMIGMPEDYSARMVYASRNLIKGGEDAAASNDFVTETIRQLVMRRKTEPARDLATWMLEHPSGLTDDEVVQHLRVVLLTGYESTANLLANTLRMVLTDRRFRASLAGGHMTLPDAVEHVLWNEPPLAVVPARWATGDTELAGQGIKEGDMLLLGLAAGNVDPAIRPDIDAPMLGNRSHLAFSGGPHECPGQDFGRAITDTGIDTLLMRLPDLHVTVDESELTWVASWVSRHLAALPVGFKRRKPTTVEPLPKSTGIRRGRHEAPAAPEGAKPSDDAAGASELYGRRPDPAQVRVAENRTSVWQAMSGWLRGR